VARRFARRCFPGWPGLAAAQRLASLDAATDGRPNPAGTRFTWEGEDGSWGFLINAAGQCMQWSNSLDQLQANSACQAGNGAQYFWPYAGAPDGSEVIKQYDEGTGPNMEIPDLSGSYIQFVNGNNGGTALSWQQ